MDAPLRPPAPLRAIRVAVVIAAVATMAASPSPARPAEPVRSGTIVGGLITTGGSHECSLLPDCAAWLASGCSPTLAGQDPAWTASVVDVADLVKDGRPRVFEYQSIFATAYIQFWTGKCREIRPARIDSSEPNSWHRKTLHLPAEAKWMTVSGNSGVHFRWTLT